MGRRGRKKLLTVLLYIVWLAVVAGSVFIVLTRRDEYGYWVVIVPGMAVCMLTIFVSGFLPKSAREKPLTEWLGRLSVLMLILFALAVLGLGVFSARGMGAKIVLGVFFIVFLNILRDYIRHLRKASGKSGNAGDDKTA